MKNKGFALLIILIVGITSILLLTRTSEVPSKKATIGLDAPSFELKDTMGNMWRLSDLKGRIVLLNFWASWCDSCKEENPSIQRFIDSEKGNDKMIFLSILFRDDPSKAMQYMKANNFTFPVLIADKDIAMKYGITGVPETFIIGKDGMLKEKIIGPIHWDTPEVKAAIARFIDG
ncbi:MAG: TlpA disulfide reductase family protein [Thermodesulfovibrionales bacterium]|nr:TlpA disulfide reductase family protein [Thermodesulfovibrionales bacterium]